MQHKLNTIAIKHLLIARINPKNDLMLLSTIFHRLLSDIGVKHPIILVRLADMVVGFITQAFSFGKEILTARVQCHVKKILTQTTQSFQGIKLLRVKSSKLILLSGVHL